MLVNLFLLFHDQSAIFFLFDQSGKSFLKVCVDILNPFDFFHADTWTFTNSVKKQRWHSMTQTSENIPPTPESKETERDGYME